MKKRKIVWIILALIFLLMFLFSGYILLRQLGVFGKDDGSDAREAGKKGSAEDVFSSETSTQTTETESDEAEDTTEPSLPDNPVDFANLWGYNEDVYAWIEVPGTPIDYPILQSSESSDYYHRRNWLGESDVAGCIYTQYYNRKDFTDPNTVIYGHYMWDGTFFGSLHDFRDPEFFAENRYIYIYIPGHALKYEIFAAYEYDNRHILGAYNFSNDEEFEKYLQTCLNPASMSRNVLEGVTLTAEDRIVTLSTCLANGDSSKRYLVQGVLVEDVQTK